MEVRGQVDVNSILVETENKTRRYFKRGAGRRWSDEENQKLRDAVAAGRTLVEAATIVGRPYHATKEHWRWLNMSRYDKEQRMARICDARRDRSKGIRPVPERSNREKVPAHVFQDRERRSIIPRSITCTLMGDPPPGYSALDRRRVEERGGIPSNVS